MHEIEIMEIPPLSSGEQSLLDMHSVVNVLNVLRCELTVLGIAVADDEGLFRDGIGICDTLLASLCDRRSALGSASHIEDYERAIMAELESKLARSLVPMDRCDVGEAVANIRTVFIILRVRAREILARAAAPERWSVFEIEKLRTGFLTVFAAIEKHSKGRFRIVYNAACREPNDYYIDFKIESAQGTTVIMPPVFQDVMRDLIANARKYTAPGGQITAALYQDDACVRFFVEDTGRGIPADELATVVHFGRRASNVDDVRTLGGGFGLTKAFLVTKQFGGRFWIGSELGRGTRVRIWMPCPASPDVAAAAAANLTVAATG